MDAVQTVIFARTDYPVSLTPRDTDLVDVKGDGYLDLVVATNGNLWSRTLIMTIIRSRTLFTTIFPSF